MSFLHEADRVNELHLRASLSDRGSSIAWAFAFLLWPHGSSVREKTMIFRLTVLNPWSCAMSRILRSNAEILQRYPSGE